MATLTDEQKALRAAARRRNEALAAEAEHERREDQQREWRAGGAYLTGEEFEAGELCRGCGLPLLDALGSWPYLNDRTPEVSAAYEVADADFSARHADCHGGRWSMSGSRTWHCSNCCPPHPMSRSQLDFIMAILRTPPGPKELDAWRLTLTCDHAVDRSMHRSNQRWPTSVVECPKCDEHRGVVDSERRVGRAPTEVDPID